MIAALLVEKDRNTRMKMIEDIHLHSKVYLEVLLPSENDRRLIEVEEVTAIVYGTRTFRFKAEYRIGRETFYAFEEE